MGVGFVVTSRKCVKCGHDLGLGLERIDRRGLRVRWPSRIRVVVSWKMVLTVRGPLNRSLSFLVRLKVTGHSKVDSIRE